MADTRSANSEIGRILVKLRASSPLGAAAARANLRPVFDRPSAGGGFGVDGAAQWFIADVPDLAVSPGTQANPWDFAHARVADQLGVAEDDLVFAEPDWVHGEAFRVNSEGQGTCAAIPQDPDHGKPVGPGGFAWHLGAGFSQLAAARAAVRFADPRVRIGHLDTGYDPNHETRPKHLLRDLGRSFVEEDRFQNSAVDPDNDAFLLDNSGHGTGTLGILAGGSATAPPEMLLGGAPEAEVLPVRISDRVVLLRTSALAAGLQYAADSGCDVITLSMGGLPSRLWGEVVDKLYERGVCICAAAGNHLGSTPPRVLVYPARFPRVIAVCGVMADQSPYADLDGLVLEGSFGPDSVMGQAIAAFTPNIPWPQFGCQAGVRLDGEGTSAATPQVAAAAALWLENHKQRLPRDWRRVEAVRHALFSTARKGDAKHFGNGILQAHSALGVAPDLNRPPSRTSEVSFALFRLITGLGLAETPVREQMFNLELEQRVLLNPRLQEIVPDPDREGALKASELRELMTAIIEDPEASNALRKHVAMRYPAVTGRSAPASPRTKGIVAEVVRACDAVPQLRDPAYRRLRVYAVDPSFSTRLETAGIDETTLQVRWESLEPANRSRRATPTPAGGEEPEKREPGPMGEYFEIDDVDAADAFYGMVNLDDPRLLAQDGLPPSEGNPHFHQQMVYAVAMSTVQHFERALGRPVFWRPMPDRTFRRRLTLRPHALRQANAFYSPENVALLFGYFDADADDPGTDLPGGRIYSCLSHDIIAHETTHAILDGMQRHFNQPTNPDVLAFHEAFADLVALLQHFALTDVLEHEIMRTRGEPGDGVGDRHAGDPVRPRQRQPSRAPGRYRPHRGWEVAPVAAGSSAVRDDDDAARTRGVAGRRDLRRVSRDLQHPHRGPAAAVQRWQRRLAGRSDPSRPGAPSLRRSEQERKTCPHHDHPRVGLPAAGRRDLLRISSRCYHRRPRPGPRRPPQLPGRAHRRVPPARDLSEGRVQRDVRGWAHAFSRDPALAFTRPDSTAQAMGRHRGELHGDRQESQALRRPAPLSQGTGKAIQQKDHSAAKAQRAIPRRL